MKYDFDRIIDRTETGATKWERPKAMYKVDDIIPMWIADMDFATAPPIVEAIKRRANHPIYGYTERGNDYLMIFSDWLNKRHNYGTNEKEISLSTGVMYSISAAIRLFTDVNEKIIIPTPCYHPFFEKVEGNGRKALLSPMKVVNGRYQLDFENLEHIVDKNTKMFLFCNPHNPTGRVFDKEELLQIALFCERNKLIIISDEIHADFVYGGSKFFPIMNISEYTKENTISCVSCTKSFNLAGLKVSSVIIKNKKMLNKFKSYASLTGIGSINIFALEALKAAYGESEEWLDQLINYLESNRNYTQKFLQEELKELQSIKPDATYFYWIDFSKTGIPKVYVHDKCALEGKVAFNEGTTFGNNYMGFERLNFACPKSQLQDALNRLKKLIHTYKVK